MMVTRYLGWSLDIQDGHSLSPDGVAVEIVVPIASHDPTADLAYRPALRSARRSLVDASNHELDEGALVEADHEWKAAVAPRVHDVIQIEIRIDRLPVRSDLPAQSGRVDPRSAHRVGVG